MDGPDLTGDVEADRSTSTSLGAESVGRLPRGARLFLSQDYERQVPVGTGRRKVIGGAKQGSVAGEVKLPVWRSKA